MEFNPFTLRVLPPPISLCLHHPIKAGYLRVKFLFVLTPSFSGHSPYVYSETPHNATGHGKEEREMHHSVPVIEGIHTSPLCFAQQNIGEVSEGRRG